MAAEQPVEQRAWPFKSVATIFSFRNLEAAEPPALGGAEPSVPEAQVGRPTPSENGSNFDAKTLQTFTSASSASQARLVRALLRYARPFSGDDDPMQSRATHDGTKNFEGTSTPSRRLIRWLRDSAAFIRSRPTRAARRRSFQAILQVWNQFRTRRSLELAQQSLRMFYIDVDNLHLSSDVHAKRVMMDFQSWQREVEQMFQGLASIRKSCPGALRDNILVILRFCGVKAPTWTLRPPDRARDFRANLNVDWNRSTLVKRAPHILATNRDQFYNAMSEKMRRWLPHGDEAFNLQCFNANIRILNPRDDDHPPLEIDVGPFHPPLEIDMIPFDGEAPLPMAIMLHEELGIDDESDDDGLINV